MWKSRRRNTSKAKNKKNRTLDAIEREGAGQAIVYRPMGGQAIKRSLVYVEEFQSLDPGTAGVPAIQVFRANGMYDPRVATGGHQPRGFDQFMALYDHFIVLGSKITLHGCNTDTSQSTFLGVTLRDSTITESNAIRDYTEGGMTDVCLLGPLGSNTQVGKVTYSCNPAKYLGRPWNATDLKGSSISDPAEEAYYHIWVQPQAATDAAAVRTSIVIEYFAIFIEGKNPGGS